LNPTVQWTSFGSREGDDVLSALEFLRGLKTPGNQPQVGQQLGIYGIELGGYAGLRAAARDQKVRALVLDSLPEAPDQLFLAAVKSARGIDTPISQILARIGIRAYFLGRYDNTATCDVARTVNGPRILLLSGPGADYLRAPTVALARCFGSPNNVEARTDLALTGYQQPSATGEQGEAYDRQVIEFFDRTLRAAAPEVHNNSSQ